MPTMNIWDHLNFLGVMPKIVHRPYFKQSGSYLGTQTSSELYLVSLNASKLINTMVFLISSLFY